MGHSLFLTVGGGLIHAALQNRNFLKRNEYNGSLDRIKAAVSVDIQRHTGVGMPHQILQAFHIKPRLLDVGAEGVTQHMGVIRGTGLP